MQSGGLILLILQGLAFAIWAFFFFKALFQIRAIAVSDTGSSNPGPVSFLSAMRAWMADPATRTTRICWLLAFAAMIVLTILTATQSAAVQ